MPSFSNTQNSSFQATYKRMSHVQLNAHYFSNLDLMGPFIYWVRAIRRSSWALNSIRRVTWSVTRIIESIYSEINL